MTFVHFVHLNFTYTMADSTSPSEFNAFDNDFEKVDPLVPGLSDFSADNMTSLVSGMADPFVSSSNPAEDIYSASDDVQNQLLDFGISPEKPAAPEPVVPSKPSEPVEIAKPVKPVAQSGKLNA